MDIIKLNGSVELGPIVRLADVIVDIVETGFFITARNDLSMDSTASSISACVTRMLSA